MKNGFVKVGVATPEVRPADVSFNLEQICKVVEKASKKQVKLLAFPELCLTGSTCGDLFFQKQLLDSAGEALQQLRKRTVGTDMLLFVGLPVMAEGRLYNVVAVLQGGNLLGLVPKRYPDRHKELCDVRQFSPGPEAAGEIVYHGERVPFGSGLLFQGSPVEELVVTVVVGKDDWHLCSPVEKAVAEGATVVVNCLAAAEVVTKTEQRRRFLTVRSAKLAAGYLCANAGPGESTTDMVFGGGSMIAENGKMLCEIHKFQNDCAITELDVERLALEQSQKFATPPQGSAKIPRIPVTFSMENTKLTRNFANTPFVPESLPERTERCEEILHIQAYGLKKRLEHIGTKKVLLGLSGGVDSTLALLAIVRAFDLLQYKREGIVAVTMPCFGTTERTYENACRLAKRLGTTLREISIEKAVKQHFADIGQSMRTKDAAYENAQARERTQVLMDLANQENGLVVGTGDLSELVLGWATYNGDHMSMYGINGGIPKTMVRALVQHSADITQDTTLQRILLDILDTPVSPELLPPSRGKIAQKTEDLVGPYELHDFFLYYTLRFGYTPGKVYRIAKYTFSKKYSAKEIKKWLSFFYQRFFSQQFKRSCLPDGPKVGSVGVSPRGGLCMPSDGCMGEWLWDEKG